MGKTKIQLWELSALEDLDDAYQDPQTGELEYPPTHITVSSKRDLYHANEPGRRLVRLMFRNYGAGDRLLVLFDDSKDLYELNTLSGGLTLIYSSVNEPRLAADYRDRWSFNHTQKGFLYCLCTSSNASGVAEALILVDSDRDGHLNPEATLLQAGSQLSSTFGDPTLIEEIY